MPAFGVGLWAWMSIILLTQLDSVESGAWFHQSTLLCPKDKSGWLRTLGRPIVAGCPYIKRLPCKMHSVTQLYCFPVLPGEVHWWSPSRFQPSLSLTKLSRPSCWPALLIGECVNEPTQARMHNGWLGSWLVILLFCLLLVKKLPSLRLHSKINFRFSYWI